MKSDVMTFDAEFRSGVRARLAIGACAMRCDWYPDFPRNMPAPEREAFIQSYRAWRDDCLKEFARSQKLTIRTFQIAGVDCITFASEASA